MYIVLAILLFGILIAAHEWGHFIAARLCGVTVHEFASASAKYFSRSISPAPSGRWFFFPTPS